MKSIAIVNPESKAGTTGRNIEVLRQRLETMVDTVFVSEYKGHCTAIVKEHPDYDTVVGIGGDGTLFEIVAGMNIENQRLAIIPSGTGNSLAQDMGLFSVEQGIQRIKDHTFLYVDYMDVCLTNQDGTVTKVRSMSTIGIGYPARLTHRTNTKLKGLGKMSYAVASVIESMNKEYFTVTVKSDEVKETLRLSGLLLSNCRHAANFKLFPDARLDDGKIHMMELNAGFWKQTIHNIALLTGKMFYNPTRMTSAKMVDLCFSSPQNVLVDGEVFSDIINMKVENREQKLQCLYQRS